MNEYVVDEVEAKIIASCKARGVPWEYPVLRYQMERDRQQYIAEFAAYVARLSDSANEGQ
jgi:hypothetical protein